MLIPLTVRGTNAPDDPAQRIDRTLDDRGQRLIAGLSVSRNFDRIDAVLVVAVGHGKYLRVRHVEADSYPVPETLQNALQELTADSCPSIADANQLSSDIALTQAGAFEKIKCRAGKYVDRILAIAVLTPSLWWKDFDGTPHCLALSDSVRLSELTGVTVIDDFPARDVAAGGTGQRLDALPFWLLHADRAPKIAADHRLVLMYSNEATGYWLPASDGLDAELPNIRLIGPTPGVEFLDDLFNLRLKGDSGSTLARLSQSEVEKLYAQGMHRPKFVSRLDRLWRDSLDQRVEKYETTLRRLAEIVSEPEFNEISLADIIRSAVYWVTDMVVSEISPAVIRADQVYFAADTKLKNCLVNQFIQAAKVDRSRVEFAASLPQQQSGNTTCAISAAVLGLLHIDQMPANVPALTGAKEQRILGRLSMGTPSNWRQLLREMADFHPPAMKLRDAI